MNFLKCLVFILLVNSNCYSQNISDSLKIYFYENEILINKVRLIAFNKNTDSIKITDLEGGVIFKQNLDTKKVSFKFLFLSRLNFIVLNKVCSSPVQTASKEEAFRKRKAFLPS